MDFVRVLQAKLNPPQFPPGISFAGQTILITGGTSGLGLEAAIHFVNLGAAHVYITARSLPRGEAAQATIEQRTGKKNVVQIKLLDMNTLAGCVEFVKTLGDIREIDYVLLNAGVHPFSFRLSPDGYEEAIQVNTLSTALLALLLLPWMKASKPHGRPQHMGIVTSNLYAKDFGSEFNNRKEYLRYYSTEKNYAGGQFMYAASKLFVMEAIEEILKLAVEKSGSPPVIINSMCPAMCRSDLPRDFNSRGGMYRLASGLMMSLFARTTSDGAKTLVLAAMTSPEENGSFVRHYGNEAELKQSRVRVLESPEGKARVTRVWHEIMEILEKRVPEVRSITRSAA